MKKSSAINEKLCQGKDVFERMNFLHQASLLVSSRNMPLASYYNSVMTSCSRKAVLRVEHNIKRSICKSCQCPLVPGKTQKVRLMPRNKKLIRSECNICKKTKKIPINKKHNLWWEQPEAVIDTFNYGSKKNNKNDSRVENAKKDNANAKKDVVHVKRDNGNCKTEN